MYSWLAKDTATLIDVLKKLAPQAKNCSDSCLLLCLKLARASGEKCRAVSLPKFTANAVLARNARENKSHSSAQNSFFGLCVSHLDVLLTNFTHFPRESEFGSWKLFFSSSPKFCYIRVRSISQSSPNSSCFAGVPSRQLVSHLPCGAESAYRLNHGRHQAMKSVGRNAVSRALMFLNEVCVAQVSQLRVCLSGVFQQESSGTGDFPICFFGNASCGSRGRLCSRMRGDSSEPRERCRLLSSTRSRWPLATAVIRSL